MTSKNLQGLPTRPAQWTRKAIARRFAGDEDVQVMMEVLELSLVDPISHERLRFPGRAKKCTHVACFDLTKHQELNKGKNTNPYATRSKKWTCPICKIAAPLGSLQVDGYFEDLLADVAKKHGPLVKAVEVFKDGTWRLPVEAVKIEEVEDEGIEEGAAADGRIEEGADAVESRELLTLIEEKNVQISALNLAKLELEKNRLNEIEEKNAQIMALNQAKLELEKNQSNEIEEKNEQISALNEAKLELEKNHLNEIEVKDAQITALNLTKLELEKTRLNEVMLKKRNEELEKSYSVLKEKIVTLVTFTQQQPVSVPPTSSEAEPAEPRRPESPELLIVKEESPELQIIKVVQPAKKRAQSAFIAAPTTSVTSSLSMVRTEKQEKETEDELLDLDYDEEEEGAAEVTPEGLVRRKAVLPARQSVTRWLHICGLKRPYAQKALMNLLGTFGTLIEDEFWIDEIKSSCIVTYEKDEQAQLARERLHNTIWPASSDRHLRVKYSTAEKLKRMKLQKAPEKTLDELFKKTKTLPAIYFLPLTEAEVLKKYGTTSSSSSSHRHSSSTQRKSSSGGGGTSSSRRK